MKISTHTGPLLHLGYRGAIGAIAEAGFDAYDFSMFDMPDPQSPLRHDGWRDTVRELRRYADSIGIVCNQSHAPFPSHRRDDREWNAHIGDWILRAIEITSILGGDVCVVHPCNDWGPEENAERVYKPLLSAGKKFGVRIGVENMWNWKDAAAVPCACSLPDNYVAHLNLLDPDRFVACLDIGHAAMFPESTSPAELITALGDRLQALHIHDNDCCHDDHTYPYTGKIDWDSVLAALRNIGYRGDVTFEVDVTGRAPHRLQSEGLRYLEKVGRYFVDTIGK